MACSGGRAKERVARLPGRPFRVNNIKIFDPTRTPGLEGCFMFMPAVFHENLFDDFFDPFWNDGALERAMDREERETFGKRGANMMKTDVKQTENGYDVAVDLPGCKKEDVQMELNDGYLTIQAVRNHSNDEKDDKGHYIRRETFSGTCARSFYVGDAVKKEDIHAKFEDGILHIQLPAPQQQKALPENPNLIEIE